MNACDDRRAPAGVRNAFTLVEMLVVIVIIGILAGLILYIIKVAGDQNAKAVTVTHIEKVRSAVEEFYAEYGQYPPVADEVQLSELNFRYEYPATNGVSQGVYQTITGSPPLTWGECHVFTFGLMSYLMRRYTGYADWMQGPFPNFFNPGGQWATNNVPPPGDQDRDIKAIRRWWPMIDKITDARPVVETISAAGASSGQPITNINITVRDGWARELHYRSPAPYQTYDIWSVGPDGKDGGPLARITDPQAAKDDVHSSPGR